MAGSPFHILGEQCGEHRNSVHGGAPQTNVIFKLWAMEHRTAARDGEGRICMPAMHAGSHAAWSLWSESICQCLCLPTCSSLMSICAAEDEDEHRAGLDRTGQDMIFREMYKAEHWLRSGVPSGGQARRDHTGGRHYSRPCCALSSGHAVVGRKCEGDRWVSDTLARGR